MTRPLSPTERKALIHPFLFGLGPMAFLFSKNLSEVPFRGFAVTLALILLAIFLLLWFARWRKYEICTFSAMLSFSAFSLINYGQIYPIILPLVYYPLKSRYVDISVPLVENISHLLMLGILIAAGWLLHRLLRRRISLRQIATEFLLFLSLLMVVIPAIDIVRQLSFLSAGPAPQTAEFPLPTAPAADAPDIYFFLLDGYARQDVLADVFHYDNSAFLNGLKARGFFVAAGSKSNYSQTALTIASSWNLNYLNEVVAGYSSYLDILQTENILIPYMRDSLVLRQLRAEGYRSYAFASGYAPTEWAKADEFLQPDRASSGLMESLLIETTGLRLVESAYSLLHWPFPYPGYRLHRERIRYVFDSLPDLVTRPGPKIVIAHLMAPHPPFVVDAEGNEIPPKGIYRLADASDFEGTYEEYVEGYRGQVAWVNRRMTDAVDTILRNSARPPVIILMGDHGPGLRLDWSDPQPEGIHDRMRNLTALYLPGGGRPEPYPAITPINIFRLVFDRYLGTAYGFLPDRSLFSSYYPFRIITEDTAP